jgi:ribonuclease HI
MSDKKEKLNAIIYTDGSARPNPGTYSGWGNYGYTYVDSVTYDVPDNTKGLKVNTETTKGEDGKPAEPVKIEEWNSWGGLKGIADNNEGETFAITNAINYAIDKGITNLEIRSDSQFALKSAGEWLKGWKGRGWKKANGTSAPYLEHMKLLDTAITNATNVKIKYTWVKGHSGNVGNDNADICANKGGTLAGAGIYEPVFEPILETGTDGKNEGKPVKPKKDKVPPYNRLMQHSKWYFSTNTDKQISLDGRSIYLFGIHSDNDLYGKRVSDACNSVVFLKEEMKVLEAIRDKQNEVGDEYAVPIYGRFDAIRSTKTYPDIYRDGTDYLQVGMTTPTLTTVEGNILTEPARPLGLAFIGMETLDHLTDRLEEHLNPDFRKGKKKSEMISVDVTDFFYVEEEDSKGKVKLTPSKAILDNAKFLTVSAEWKSGKRTGNKDVVLTIGLDAPTKNMLNAMSKDNPTIKVITWPESKQTIRYAVVVETKDDVALYASAYSNLCLV